MRFYFLNSLTRNFHLLIRCIIKNRENVDSDFSYPISISQINFLDFKFFSTTHIHNFVNICSKSSHFNSLQINLHVQFSVEIFHHGLFSHHKLIF